MPSLPASKNWERTQVAQPRIRSVALNDPLRSVHRYIDHSPFGAFNVFLRDTYFMYYPPYLRNQIMVLLC
jgi:hypothetical protein